MLKLLRSLYLLEAKYFLPEMLSIDFLLLVDLVCSFISLSKQSMGVNMSPVTLQYTIFFLGVEGGCFNYHRLGTWLEVFDDFQVNGKCILGTR